jgi:hypothetical protein
MSDSGPAAWMVGSGIAAYRGKKDCDNVTCTRFWDVEKQEASKDCYGWHCALCDEPTDSQGGHRCLISEKTP